LDSLHLLDRLIAFPTVSDRSNLQLISFVREFLTSRGFEVMLVEDDTGAKANLFATLGPAGTPGIILSGHTDVVPVEGQAWSSDPFVLTQRGEQLFGRGTTDMKGFVACALRAADLASRGALSAPLHIALSHDEEIGCIGVRSLLDKLRLSPPKVRLCIVGEPTSMSIGLGHKGKLAARAVFHGVGGHSAQAPRLLNALHLAAEFVLALRHRQDVLKAQAVDDPAYDIPYTTVHAGVAGGGTALNLVPERAFVDFEIRAIGSVDSTRILAAIAADAEQIVAAHRARFPHAVVEIATINSYPGLETAADTDAVSFVRGLLDSPSQTKFAFGTEGGLFSEKLGVPVVICGPGSMTQAHIADEFITRDQVAACDRMMDRLVKTLAA
jgi:acetylornithine deacetylase